MLINLIINKKQGLIMTVRNDILNEVTFRPVPVSQDDSTINDKEGIKAKVELQKPLKPFKLYRTSGGFCFEVELSADERKTVEKAYDTALETLNGIINGGEVRDIDFKYGIVEVIKDGKIISYTFQEKLELFDKVKEIIRRKCGVTISETNFESRESKCVKNGNYALLKSTQTLKNTQKENIPETPKGIIESIKSSINTIFTKPSQLWNRVREKKYFEEFARDYCDSMKDKPNIKVGEWKAFDDNIKTKIDEHKTNLSREADEEKTKLVAEINKKKEDIKKINEKVQQKTDEIEKNKQKIETLQSKKKKDEKKHDEKRKENEDDKKGENKSNKEKKIEGLNQYLVEEKINLEKKANDLENDKDYKDKKERLENGIPIEEDSIKYLDTFAIKVVAFAKKYDKNASLTADSASRIGAALRLKKSLEKMLEKNYMSIKDKLTTSPEEPLLTKAERDYCSYVASMLLKDRVEYRDFATKCDIELCPAPYEESFLNGLEKREKLKLPEVEKKESCDPVMKGKLKVISSFQKENE